MAPLEAEWLIWAKRMRDEHDKQSAKIENLSKTLEKQAQEVTSSKTEQAALRAEHTSLKAELAKDKAAHATDMAERAQEIAILREQVQAMVEPGRNDAKTGLTSQPYDSDSTTLPQEVEHWCKVSAQKSRNWSGQAQPSELNHPIEARRMSSEESALGEPNNNSDDILRSSNWLLQATRYYPSSPIFSHVRIGPSKQQVLEHNEQALGGSTTRSERSLSVTRSHISSEASIVQAFKANNRQGKFSTITERSSSATRSDISRGASIVMIPDPRDQSQLTSLEAQNILIKPQNGLSLQEYLILSGDDLAERQAKYEKEFVEAFVDGLNDEAQKTTLRARLEEDGTWTWTKAFEKSEEIVEEALQRKILGKNKSSPLREPNGRFARKNPRRE